MNYTMTLYSMPHCGPCNEFKQWLREQNISYLDKDITNDLEVDKEFKNLGFMYTPTTIIKVNSEEHTIVGANIKKISELLSL
ncbi:glutaredoxin family protein [Peribacillus muralis]|uniref:glutaredoxin family protein n=1 Tax=Peribacillus muralis TaxID=264697 RepID=UPI0007104607|nr:glutaredoxin domain-containing protein [Peribacillus muralis]